MTQRTTPQQLHATYTQACQEIATLREGYDGLFGNVPAAWEELSDEQQEQFRNMALSMNSIIGEFEVE